MEAKRKDEFKKRFREFDNEWLIENALRPLTEEAAEATRELLEERGLAGESLQLKVSAVKKEIITRSGVTSHCDYCGAAIAFDSIRVRGQRFCSERCRDESALLVKSVDLAPDLIFEHAVRMKFGACPECGTAGNGVEMRPAHFVFSALVVTHFERKVQLRCRRCARKASLLAAVACLFLGWWSIPGFFSTPVLIVRNLREALSRRVDEDPSEALLFKARLDLARDLPDFSGMPPGVRSGTPWASPGA